MGYKPTVVPAYMLAFGCLLWLGKYCRARGKTQAGEPYGRTIACLLCLGGLTAAFIALKPLFF